MSLITPWGYTITDADSLTAILTADEFNVMTAGKYSGDVRIAPNISAACAAVRNYCGWHIYPELTCSLTERLLHGNGRVKRIGPDLLIQLPAVFVPGITSVVLEDEEWEDYDLATNGVIRLFDVGDTTRKSQVVVTYTAGLAAAMLDSLKELIAGRITHALAQPYGVQSESAGGVSITYSSSWATSASATALPDDNKETLEPFRVRGVF